MCSSTTPAGEAAAAERAAAARFREWSSPLPLTPAPSPCRPQARNTQHPLPFSNFSPNQTNSIREKAELKLYSALGKQAKRKRQAMGDLKIVVAGCVAAQASGEKGGGGTCAAACRRTPRRRCRRPAPSVAAWPRPRAPPSSPPLPRPPTPLPSHTRSHHRHHPPPFTQEGETLLRRVPELDLVMGPHHANRLGELLERVDQGNQVCARVCVCVCVVGGGGRGHTIFFVVVVGLFFLLVS